MPEQANTLVIVNDFGDLFEIPTEELQKFMVPANRRLEAEQRVTAQMKRIPGEHVYVNPDPGRFHWLLLY